MDVLRSLQPIPLYPIDVDLPAAGVIANAEDMARYVAFQLDGGQLLRPELLEALHTPQVSMAGPWTTGQAAVEAARQQGLPEPEVLLHDPAYAFYWITADFLDGQRMIWHDGGGAGFVANVTLLPSIRAGLVILANADRADDFTEAVRLHSAEALLHVDLPHDTQAIVQAQEQVLGQDLASRDARFTAARAFTPDPSMLEALAADYQTVPGAAPVSVRVVSGGQLVIAGDPPPLGRDATLVPYAADAFLVNGGDLKGSARVAFEGGRLALLFGGQLPIPLAPR